MGYPDDFNAAASGLFPSLAEQCAEEALGAADEARDAFAKAVVPLHSNARWDEHKAYLPIFKAHCLSLIPLAKKWDEALDEARAADVETHLLPICLGDFAPDEWISALRSANLWFGPEDWRGTLEEIAIQHGMTLPATDRTAGAGVMADA